MPHQSPATPVIGEKPGKSTWTGIWGMGYVSIATGSGRRDRSIVPRAMPDNGQKGRPLKGRPFWHKTKERNNYIDQMPIIAGAISR
jgi:hypothetical protein